MPSSPSLIVLLKKLQKTLGFGPASVPACLLVIPFLWSIIGVSAAVNLRVPQDYGLVVAGVLGTALILIQNRKAKKRAQLTPVDG
jgi:hypothetical protein